MKKYFKLLFALGFGLLLNTASLAQVHLVYKDSIFIVLNTTGANATTDSVFMVLDNGDDGAVKTTGAGGGNLITKHEKNYFKWNIGTNAGTYNLPFATDITASNPSRSQIPLTLTLTAGTGDGNIKFSSYTDNDATDNFNLTDYKPSDVAHVDRSGDDIDTIVVNRYWIMDANGYTSKPSPTMDFGYDYEEVIAGGNKIRDDFLEARRWNASANDWFDIEPGGTVNPATKVVTGVSVSASEFRRSWMLVGVLCPEIVTTNPGDTCAPNTIDITNRALYAGSKDTLAGTWNYWTDAGATSLIADPTAVSSSGTYYITNTGIGCTDTAQIDVTVNATPDLSITQPAAVCSPNTIDLTDAAVTAGSTTYGGTLTYFTDAGATSAYATPTAADSNAYYIVVTTGASCADTAQVNAVVNPTPTISSVAENSPSGCGLNDGSIIFSGLSSTTDYLLSYNSTVDSLVKSDASGDIKLLNLTSGNYINISIKGVVGGCSDVTADITLLEPNIPLLDAGAAQEVCEGEFVTLSATTNGGSTISWDNSVVNGVAFQPGVGAIKYTVTIDSSSCVTTDSVMVTVNGKPDLTITDPAAVCVPNTIDLTDAAVTAGSTTYGATFTYYTDAGATSEYTTPTTANSGAYFIVANTGADCSDTAQVNAFIKAGTFIASVTGGNPSGCGVNDGTITIGGLTASTNYLLSYNATVDSAVTSNSSGEIVLMNLLDGVYTGIDVRVAGGCFNDTKWEVTLASPDKPFVDAGSAQEVCEGEFVTLSATTNGGATISWDNSVVDGVSFYPGVGTIKYTVTIDSNSCVATDSVMVTVHGKPELIITDPASVCAPSTVDITATSITVGSSDLGTNTYYTDATLSTLITDATAVGSGTYSIVTETDESCRDTAVVNVTVGTGGSGTASATANCEVREVDLSAMVSGPDVTFYQWLVSSDSINYSVSSSLDNFTAPAIQEAWYIAEFTSTDLCVGRDTIYVSACPKLPIVIADVMTPNGDGDNDTWWVENIQLYGNNKVIIYNRWGSEVYRASGYNNDWDGTFNGKPLPVGAYYYSLEFNDEEGTNYQGVINLMR